MGCHTELVEVPFKTLELALILSIRFSTALRWNQDDIELSKNHVI